MKSSSLGLFEFRIFVYFKNQVIFESFLAIIIFVHFLVNLVFLVILPFEKFFVNICKEFDKTSVSLSFVRIFRELVRK